MDARAMTLTAGTAIVGARVMTAGGGATMTAARAGSQRTVTSF